MINKIQKEYKRFINREFKKLFGNFEPAIGDNVWSDVWKDYYIENNSNIKNKLTVLKNGLDKESNEVVDNVFERYVFSIPTQKFKNDFLYKKECFYTQKELIAQKEKFEVDKQKFKLPEGVYYETSIFKYVHGLSLIPATVLECINGKSIIDAGSFVGDSAIAFSDYTNSKIYSFEPCANNYKLLLETISLNKLEAKIIPVNAGLGESKGAITVYPTEFCNSAISVDEESKKSAHQIEVTSVDEFVREQKIDLGVLKLDVEGYELESIKGALNTIKESKPVLLISVYHHPKDFFEIKPLVESIVPEYKFMVRKLNDFSPTYETMLIGWID